MTKTLTEQWKEGELELNSLWFVRLPCGLYDECFYTGSTIFMKSISGHDEKIWQVLAPVPSYDEWQAELASNDELLNVQKRLEKKLEIATKALKEIEEHTKELSLPSYTGMLCHKALKEIKEVKND